MTTPLKPHRCDGSDGLERRRGSSSALSYGTEKLSVRPHIGSALVGAANEQRLLPPWMASQARNCAVWTAAGRARCHGVKTRVAGRDVASQRQELVSPSHSVQMQMSTFQLPFYQSSGMPAMSTMPAARARS